eukprot:458295-Pelagomonas_calceolata.AAC.3
MHTQALLAILTASSSIVTNLIRLPPPPHPGCSPLPLTTHPPNLTNTLHTSQPQSKHSKGGGSNSSISRKAVGGAHTDPAVSAVECLLQRVVPNFPATMPAVRPAPVVLEALAAYNLQVRALAVAHVYQIKEPYKSLKRCIGENVHGSPPRGSVHNAGSRKPARERACYGSCTRLHL